MDNPDRYMKSRPHLVIAALAVPLFASGGALAEVVATVNGVDIDSETFEFYLENRIQSAGGQPTPEQRDLVLQELKDIYILTTLPRAEEMAAQPRAKAQFELQYRASLAQMVASDWLANNPATEEEIQEAYEAQAQLAPDMQYKARHILVETQAAAIDLISQLDAGADFGELAVANSTGPSGPAGGDLGWFSPNQMVPPFSEAVAGLENGAYTKSPVQTEFGWHVILREDSRENEAPPLDSVRDVLKQSIEQNKFQKYLESLRADHAAQE